MSNQTYYPVFEPDQVLTDEHLNAMFAYLDQQDHLSRNKLLGIGIVCGLHSSGNGNTITITKGVGITSLGYLLQFDGGVYSHYRPYSLPDFPQTIDPAVHATYAGWDMLQLIPLTQPKEAGDTALAPNAAIYRTHVVVLFLEPLLSDLKNCTTEDCNDKGKRVDITVRPMLVHKSLLESYSHFSLQQRKFQFPEVHLKRWNVPMQQIQHPSNVIQAFDAVLSPTLLGELANALKFVYELFHPMFQGAEDDAVLQDVFDQLNELLTGLRSNSPVHYQYAYDYVDDLIRAYEEFRSVVFDLLSECCPDEMLFPLHLMLGEAGTDSETSHTPWRHYFLHSPIFEQQRSRYEEARMYYNRMVAMLHHFSFPAAASQATLTALVNATTLPIRITPSHLGTAPLGWRCIPYYYDPEPLFQLWDYQKTRRGRESLNYGYRAEAYTTDPAALQPLLYDTEAYNFYRIEGHVGRPVATALSSIAGQKLSANLPFDVVALNLYPNSTSLTSDRLQCYFSDLESHYNVMLSELLCKLHGLFCAAGKWPFTQAIFDLIFRVNTPNITMAANFVNRSFVGTDTPKEGGSEAGTEEEPINLKHSNLSGTFARSYEDSLQLAVSVAVNFVDRMRRINPYRKGSYLSFFCKPDPKAQIVATYYLNWLQANPGKRWPKPQAVALTESNNLVWGANAYLHFFYLIDSIEELLATLLPYDLGMVNFTRFKARYEEVMEEVESFAEFFDNYYHVVDMQADQRDLQQNKPFDLISEEFEDFAIDKIVTRLVADSRGLMMMCFDDRLEQLRFEYRKRTAYILEQHIFSNYARLKTGLEHKAGVPRGGTFVLLYYDRPDSRETPASRLSVATNILSATAGPAVAGATLTTATTAKTPESETAAHTADKLGGEKTMGTDFSKQASYISDSDRLSNNIKGIQQVLSINRGRFTNAELSLLQDMLGRIQGLPASAERLNIPEGVVFADLYIPYMCCSECAPTAFVFPKEEETPTPDVSMQRTFFCNHEETTEPIHISPAGGTLSGQGVSKQGDDQYVFSPYGLAAGIYVITYKLGEKTDTVSVTVQATPDPDFNYTIKGMDPSGAGILVSFTAEAQTGTHVWNFGDGSPTSGEINPTHLYQVAPGTEKNFTVTHNVSNGNCSLEGVSREILIEAPALVTLDIKNNKLCSNAAPERLFYSPEGGIMKCKETEKAIVQMNGIYYFAPALAGKGGFTIIYTHSGSSAEISVEVLEAPSAAFEYEITDSTTDAFFISFFPAEKEGNHLWEFSDGQKSEEESPSMIFKRNPNNPAPVIEARHTLQGDPCSDTQTQRIELAEKRALIESKMDICYSSKPISLEPNILTSDFIKVLDDAGQKIDEQGMMELTDTIPTGTSTIEVRYELHSGGSVAEKLVVISITRIGDLIKVNFTKTQAQFQAEGKTAVWTILAQNSTNPSGATTIVENQQANPLKLKLAELPQAVEFALIIEVEITDGNCSSSLRKSIPAQQYNELRKGTGRIEI